MPRHNLIRIIIVNTAFFGKFHPRGEICAFLAKKFRKSALFVLTKRR